MQNFESGDRKPVKDPKPNRPSSRRSLYGCLGALALLILILVLFGACAMLGGEEDDELAYFKPAHSLLQDHHLLREVA
ncbi:hypothetical protein [Indiicoccus explosivorum]|uniref:hypothetical protein n=1 Tax=Indiicoccus explosivorum TaxID=1917864 RepID=UPI000B44900A|nr:hypothetical protein [Indiicoccus explosivorum]